MNNNITEDYCSVEIGKLLCDKGFPQITGFENECPTHALAIKWIRENFGVDIHTEWSQVNYLQKMIPGFNITHLYSNQYIVGFNKKF